MQRAFYYEGKSLSNPTTYREIAITHHLDPEAVLDQFKDVASTKDARDDFKEVQQIGVHSYPTLLLQRGDAFIEFGGGAMTVEHIEERFNLLIQELQQEKIVEPPVGMACNIDSGNC